MKDIIVNSTVELSPEEMQQLKNATDQIRKQEEEEFQKWLLVIEKAKNKVSHDMSSDIQAYIDETNNYGYTCEYSIVSEPEGDYQTEPDYPHMKGLWIDQFGGGGLGGDCFSAYAYIKICEKEYLKFNYSTY